LFEGIWIVILSKPAKATTEECPVVRLEKWNEEEEDEKVRMACCFIQCGRVAILRLFLLVVL